MNANELSSLPWPIILIDRDGHILGCTSSLRAMLQMEILDAKNLAERFEILTPSGDALASDKLPWIRAARGHEFQERETWYNKRLNSRIQLQVQSRWYESVNAAILLFLDESEYLCAQELSGFVNSVAGSLLKADDPSQVAHAIVEQIAGTMKADVVYLSSASLGSERLLLLGSLGLPPDYARELKLIPFDSAYLAADAARSLEIKQVDRIERLPIEQFEATRRLLRIGMRSLFAVPLIASGELVGVVSLARKQPGKLLPIEVNLVKSVADASAVALQKARSREIERHESMRLRVISEEAMVLERSPQLHNVLYGIVEKACQLTHSRYGALGVLKPEKTGLSDFITFGLTAEEVKHIGHLPIGKGLLGTVISAKHTVRVADISKDPRSAGLPPHHPKMTSFLGTPLQIGQEIFGNFYLTDKEGGQPFSDEDERLIELFSGQAALVIDYARQLDITQEQRQRLDAVLRHIPEGIIFTAAPEGALVMANPAAERILGHTLSVQQTAAQLGPAFGFQHLDGRLYEAEEMPSFRALRGEAAVGEELRILQPSGRTVPAQVSTTPVRSRTGEILGAVMVIQDVSQARELELLREGFAAVIAHDLRNPIQSISIQIDSLLRQAHGKAEITVPRGVLVRIQRNGLRLAQMAQDLLDAGRIEFKRLYVDLKSIDPVHNVSDLVHRMAATLHGHPTDIRTEGTIPHVLADPTRFDQIVSNVLENAAKYSSEGSPIIIRMHADGGGATLSIQDFGMGITPEEMPKLFDRFYQSKRARQKKTGLGLGLYITKGLVDALGGRIRAESIPGKGSTFHIWLPAAAEAAERKSA